MRQRLLPSSTCWPRCGRGSRRPHIAQFLSTVSAPSHEYSPSPIIHSSSPTIQPDNTAPGCPCITKMSSHAPSPTRWSRTTASTCDALDSHAVELAASRNAARVVFDGGSFANHAQLDFMLKDDGLDRTSMITKMSAGPPAGMRAVLWEQAGRGEDGATARGADGRRPHRRTHTRALPLARPATLTMFERSRPQSARPRQSGEVLDSARWAAPMNILSKSCFARC